MSLPLSVHDIINLSVEAFNEAISSCKLNHAQHILIRDIRRRGKNKMAAQSCRQNESWIVLLISKKRLRGWRLRKSKSRKKMRGTLENFMRRKRSSGNFTMRCSDSWEMNMETPTTLENTNYSTALTARFTCCHVAQPTRQIHRQKIYPLLYNKPEV